MGLTVPVLLPWGAWLLSIHESGQEAYEQVSRLAALGVEASVYLLDPWVIGVPLSVDVQALQQKLETVSALHSVPA